MAKKQMTLMPEVFDDPDTHRGDGPRPKISTVSGYALDEVRSALHKAIRRGHEKEAVYWAMEMAEKQPGYLWRSLVSIAAEDIGLANMELVTQVCVIRGEVESMFDRAKQMGRNIGSASYEYDLLPCVVLAMARSPKNRDGDNVQNEICRMRQAGIRLEVPDYALDQHTERGRYRGRGAEHFWTEGVKLRNEVPSRYVGWDPVEGDAGNHPSGAEKEWRWWKLPLMKTTAVTPPLPEDEAAVAGVPLLTPQQTHGTIAPKPRAKGAKQ